MNQAIQTIREEELLNAVQPRLDTWKTHSLRPEATPLVGSVYIRSLYIRDGVLYCIARDEDARRLYIASKAPIAAPFAGEDAVDQVEGPDGDIHYRVCPLSAENASHLMRLFPFTAPVSLRERRTTVGMGDRIGMASAGHLRAARKFGVDPVVAQQSIRELDFTGRTFDEVVADAAWMVFQEGYELGYGADGDHLKTIPAIDTALKAGMPMITLDLTEVMHPEVADWSDTEVDDAFAGLPTAFRDHVHADYADATFPLDDTAIGFTAQDAKRCALLYGDAIDFAVQVDGHLRAARGDAYDLEVSIDETTTPTIPNHHLFIARELHLRGVRVNSVAPRFVGDFQKAIDYIGDIEEFDRQLALHCAIARGFGGYKISVHSGSDKFSVYPSVGEKTGLRLHLKTSGTSWLESLRLIAIHDPGFYREIHAAALRAFPEALKHYHITADIDAIADPAQLADQDIAKLLDDANCRQLLHISYGGLLNDPTIRGRYFAFIHRYGEEYYALIESHFAKHLSKLGLTAATA